MNAQLTCTRTDCPDYGRTLQVHRATHEELDARLNKLTVKLSRSQLARLKSMVALAMDNHRSNPEALGVADWTRYDEFKSLFEALNDAV